MKTFLDYSLEYFIHLRFENEWKLDTKNTKYKYINFIFAFIRENVTIV